MNNPKVSIVIPLYNSSFYLPGLLESISEQTLQDYEIIIVNDGSPEKDREEKILSSYAGNFKDNMICLNKVENEGIAKAWNHGFAAARGEYFAWIGHDDRYFPEALDIMSRYLDKNKDVGMVYGDIVLAKNGNIKVPFKREEIDFYNQMVSLDGIIERLKFDYSGKKIILYGDNTFAKIISHALNNFTEINILDRNEFLGLDNPDILKDFDKLIVMPLFSSIREDVTEYLMRYLSEDEFDQKVIFLFDMIKNAKNRIDLESPIKLSKQGDMFNEIDSLSYLSGTNRINCTVLRRWKFSDEDLLKSNIITVIFMFRKDIYEKVGKFNDKYIIPIDWDYWLRISENTKIHHIPKLLGIVNDSLECYHHQKKELCNIELESVIAQALSRRNTPDRKWRRRHHTFIYD